MRGSLGGGLQAPGKHADGIVVTDPRAPLRVCHLIHDLGPGGAEHVLVDLAGVAASAGLDMSVVSMMPTTGLRYPAMLRDLGVDVHTLGLRGWWDPRGPQRLRRLVAALDPQVLHSHLKHADVVAGRVARDADIPHVSTLHVIEDAVGPIGRWKRDVAIRSRTRTAAMTIAVSEAQRTWYLEVSGARPDRVRTIYNGVPDPGLASVDARDEVRTELGLSADDVVMAMVAVMRPGKGHDVLLGAFGLLRSRPVLLIVGDGASMPEVRRRAAPFGDRVRLLGFREDVPRLLRGVDLVVHPTRTDALPTALVHAIAAGLPVVASAVGGVPEIVPPGAGELVPPGDPGALAAALDRIVAATDRHRMGAEGRARFEARFEATRWAATLADLYRAVPALPV